MRWSRLVAAAWVALLVTGSTFAQTITVRMVADNYFAGYTGTATAATTMNFNGAWPTPAAPAPFQAAGPFLFVVAWDDGSSLQGLLGSVASGSGIVPTGSSLWTVCATGQLLPSAITAAPTAAALTSRIVACNTANAWQATTAGPNNENASNHQIPSGTNLWGKTPAIEPTANWIWNTNATQQCAGTNGFLAGPCNPGEYLIFRLRLDQVAGCLPPVPAFTINWTTGFGTVVADGTTSQHELNHFWSVQESDASWNRFGPEVTQWFQGTAGVFDVKSFYETGARQRLKCDTYYRVKLAVGNNCINWRDTTRLIRVKCCPGEVSGQTP